MELLFAEEDQLSLPEAPRERRPWTGPAVEDEDAVVFCGHRLSVEDFIRAREAKSGQLAEYKVSESFVASHTQGLEEKAAGSQFNSVDR